MTARSLAAPQQSSVDRFLPYLHEVQRHLITLLLIFGLGTGLGFIYYQKILLFIMGLFNLKGVTIVLTSPYQFLNLAINTGLLLGLLTVFPFLIFYFLKFIRPALRPQEYRLLIRLVPLALFLFAIGFGFGLWIMNFVIKLFYQTAQNFNLNNLWDISHFFSQTLITAISLGLVFQFPIILTGLLRFKIIRRRQLTQGRRFVYASCLLFATLLPPTDLLSLALITVPLIILFELTLLLNPRKEVK